MSEDERESPSPAGMGRSASEPADERTTQRGHAGNEDSAERATNSTSRRRDSVIPLPDGFRGAKLPFEGIEFTPVSGAMGVAPRSEARPAEPLRLSVDAPRLLRERAEGPSEDSPIVYRERTYVVDSLQDDDVLERQLLAELRLVQRGLASRDAPLFVQLALFDHEFEDEPAAPPIATLSWKDWQGTAEVWLRGIPRPAPIPLALHREAEPASAPMLSQRARQSLERLFDRMHELLYLSDARSASQYVLNAIESHLPADGALIFLYDAESRSFVVEKALGRTPETVIAARAPQAGSLLAEAHQRRGALRLDSSSDEATLARFHSLGVELYTGLCAPVQKGNRPLGAIEVARERGAVAFDRGELLILEYVCDQLADFLDALD